MFLKFLINTATWVFKGEWTHSNLVQQILFLILKILFETRPLLPTISLLKRNQLFPQLVKGLAAAGFYFV